MIRALSLVLILLAGCSSSDSTTPGSSTSSGGAVNTGPKNFTLKGGQK